MFVLAGIPKTGELLDGKYELLSELGSGGIGTVFKARQIDCDRILAIKIVHRDVIHDDDTKQRLIREARLLSQLSHPNIVTIYGIGTTPGGLLYLTMEYVEGKSLRAIINEEKQLPPARALSIALSLAKALVCVHQAGIIHRDIKPENIILVNQPAVDTVKLIDFGLAREEQEKSDKLTQTGLLIGTVAYMSPEQCQGRKALPASDIYSLGICIFEMLAGTHPFTADNYAGIIYKHLSEPAPALQVATGRQYSRELELVIQTALSKAAKDRFASIEEMVTALEQALEAEQYQSIDGKTFAKTRISPKVTIGISVSIILTILMATLILLQPKPSGPALEKLAKLPAESASRQLSTYFSQYAAINKPEAVLKELDVLLQSDAFKALDLPSKNMILTSLFFTLQKAHNQLDLRDLGILTIKNYFEDSRRKVKDQRENLVGDITPIDRISDYLLKSDLTRSMWLALYTSASTRFTSAGYGDNAVFATVLSIAKQPAFKLRLLILKSCQLQSDHISAQRLHDIIDMSFHGVEEAQKKQNWSEAKLFAETGLKFCEKPCNQALLFHWALAQYFASINDEGKFREQLAEADKAMERGLNWDPKITEGYLPFRFSQYRKDKDEASAKQMIESAKRIFQNANYQTKLLKQLEAQI